MRRLARACAAAVTLVVSAGFLEAQTLSLNPTVTVLPQASGPVPPDCDVTMAPQVAQPLPERQPLPEPQPQLRPLPQPVEAPAAADVGSLLRNAHDAALARDRAAFDAALLRAKAAGTATAAERDVIAVLEDVQRLWDYQFSTPAGAFFDASVQDGSMLALLRRYPGYDRFIENQTITDAAGNRYYPVRESIVFLLDIARARLQRAGVDVDVQQRVTAPAPPAATAPVTGRPQQPRPAAEREQPAGERRVASPQPAPSTATSPARERAAQRRTRRPAASPQPRATPDPQPQQVPVAAAEDPALPTPPGVVSTDPAPVDLVPPTTTTAVVETIAPITPETTADETATAAAAQPERGGRGIIMPLVLILIGIGVLIVLFRASS